jgi:GrpB-like predicted nucleotidyltransferase (UPF0157 family)
MTEPLVIGPYEHLPAACLAYDPRAAEVAHLVGSLIEARLPGIVVEHVGSTAVPGCAGKGVVDMMVLYPPGRLAEVRDGLAELGFSRQTTRDPVPEDRPMRTGSVEHDGTRYRLHAHVLAADSPEVTAFRAFRDRLRSDPKLVAEYVACKRGIIAGGVTDSVDYSICKGEFVERVLGLPDR